MSEEKKQVLLTGVTGFLGKVVLSELLRRADELAVEKVWVLIRPKNGTNSAAERFEDRVVRSPCFVGREDAVRRFTGVIDGDVTRRGCGLHLPERDQLNRHVTHVIHCAASVDFELPLQEAARANIDGALNVQTLAEGCRRVKLLIDVSTAYVTPHTSRAQVVPEQLVPLPRAAAALWRDIQGGVGEQALLKESGHPNTYTYSKCIAEHLLVQRRKRVPVLLVRPSIISASWQHPMPGWIDSRAAFAGFAALIGAGRLRAVVADRRSRLDIVPVDSVAQCILGGLDERPANQRPWIRHAVAGSSNSCTVETASDLVVDYFRQHPLDGQANVTYLGPKGPRFWVQDAVHHRLPRRLGTLAMRLAGHTRGVRQLERLRRTQRYLNRAFPYFTHRTFEFAVSRDYLGPDFDRRDYMRVACQGIYRHLFGRDDRQVVIAGREHTHGSDLLWALRHRDANVAIRGFGYVLRKLSRKCAERITYDHAAFEAQMVGRRDDELLVVVPSHRSFSDFVLCSYLFFNQPELGIAVPHIAADEEFSRIPFLGELFRHARAFYLKRGLGQADPALTRQIRELVDAGSTLQFFIEGTRSRTRQYLAPKRGLLRCLQSTGGRFAILPVSLTYDRLPEEKALLAEISGMPRASMRLSAVLRWVARVLRDEVSLGRIHIQPGKMLHLGPQTDVGVLARGVVAELQAATGVTTHHLQTFVERHPQLHVGTQWLRQELESRGAVVLDSPLPAGQEVEVDREESLRYLWLHRFHDEALQVFGDNPAVIDHLRRNRYCNVPTRDEATPLSPELEAVVRSLYQPVLRDYSRVGRLLVQLRQEGCQDFSADKVRLANPTAHVPHLRGALQYFCERNVLRRGSNGRYAWVGSMERLQRLAEALTLPPQTELPPNEAVPPGPPPGPPPAATWQHA